MSTVDDLLERNNDAATFAHLSQTVHLWIHRWRLQRALTWSVRGLILGLALTLAAGMIGLYRADLLRQEFLALVIAGALLSSAIFGVIAYLWRIHPLRAARRFDQLFHLGERVSTALELHEIQTHVPTEMKQRQLVDAVAASQAIDARRFLPLRLKRQEVAIGLLLVLLFGALWLRGDRWFQAAQHARNVEHAVAEQTSKIEELIQEINTNQALSEQQKEALTAPLQEAHKSLQENPSLENSVSMLTSTGEKMKALSDAQAEQMAQALKESGNQLAQQEDSPLASVGKELKQGDYTSAASQLQNLDVAALSEAEKQQLADQLQALADSVQSTNPQLASELNEAAQALQNGDPAAAQQALQNAANSLAQAGQQVTFSQVAGESAIQLQQGAGQVLAAGGGGQQANQAGQGTQSSQGSNSSDQTNGMGGSGSGSGSESGDPQPGTEADSSPIDQNNGPGDGGESTYEQIYAPTLLGGDGGPQVDLPDAGNGDRDVIGQGPTTPGDPGTSLVPYSEVYSHYQQINNQAMENGEVPAQFTQIIKNYFDSLKP